MSNINGYLNEYQFVLLFNNKTIKDLDPISYELIKTLFPYANENSVIKCWKNHYPQKSDILIKIDNKLQGISIKKGIKNSVHAEAISTFINFLKQQGIPSLVIKEYLCFHYADGTTNGSGKKRISGDEYKNNNLEKINLINNAFNNKKIIAAAIDRFVIKGTNSKYPIGAMIYGEPDDYIWLSTSEIKNIILNKHNTFSTGIHFGPLQVQPKNRCLNYNSKYEKDRFCVQIKWYNLFDNYIEYKNNNLH